VVSVLCVPPCCLLPQVVAKVFPAVVPLGQARKPDDLVIESSKSITVADGSDEVRTQRPCTSIGVYSSLPCTQTYDLDYVYDSGATVQDLYSVRLPRCCHMCFALTVSLWRARVCVCVCVRVCVCVCACACVRVRVTCSARWYQRSMPSWMA